MALQMRRSRDSIPSTALARDARGFDVECLKSALNFCNFVWAEIEPSPPWANESWLQVQEEANRAADKGEKIPITSLSLDAAAIFAWLPEVLRKRAEQLGIPATSVPDSIAAVGDVYTLNVCNEFEVLVTFVQETKPMRPEVRDFVIEEINKSLGGITFHHRLRLSDGRFTQVTLPILRNVSDCVAYAMFVLVQNQWGLIGRIRKCRYIARGDLERTHWFLDYRCTTDGRLKRGTRQEFCSPEHANRFHQREWRKRNARKSARKRSKTPTPRRRNY